VKHLAILSIALVLLLAQGCTSNDRNGAGTEASILTPASASAAPPSGGAAPISHSSDPAANGGSSLPASTPYSQPGTASVQQSVNPVPFLTASQGAGTGGTGRAPVEALTSRADGTMSGPNDQPAATTGWGTTAPPATPAAVKRGSGAPK
jgi:hypothetical protein